MSADQQHKWPAPAFLVVSLSRLAWQRDEERFFADVLWPFGSFGPCLLKLGGRAE